MDKQSFKNIVLIGTDEIEEAVTNAAEVIADSFFKQHGMADMAEDHDDEWFDLRDEIREKMLDAACDAIEDSLG